MRETAFVCFVLALACIVVAMLLSLAEALSSGEYKDALIEGFFIFAVTGCVLMMAKSVRSTR